MSAEPTESFEPIEPPRHSAGPSLGTILLGLVLVVAGLVWLLQTTDVLTLSLEVILAGVLVLIGVALVGASARGGSGGLVTLGIILTVVLVATSAINVPLTGGAGDRLVAPTRFEDLKTDQSLGAGNLTLDLRNIQFPAGETTITARVGLGQLLVELPSGVAASVHYKVGAGDATVLGRETNGASIDERTTTAGYASASNKVMLELSVGLGSIEVR